MENYLYLLLKNSKFTLHVGWGPLALPALENRILLKIDEFSIFQDEEDSLGWGRSELSIRRKCEVPIGYLGRDGA